jgi:Ca2+-binding EF-hand superfamily protein
VEIEPYARGDIAETEDLDESTAQAEPSQCIKGLLYYIAEENSKREAYEHRGIACEECGENPIRGIRWHCLNCPDYDLCSTCEAHSAHPKAHVFVKIKIPLPILSQPTKPIALWYPGDPLKQPSSLDSGTRKRLSQEFGFEEPTVDALYDQFACLANVSWESDPVGKKAAMNKGSFIKALSSGRWPDRFEPNALYDRMFAFYDTDNNGLIGLQEFISGMAYLRGTKRYTPLERAIQGFDMNRDGYVERADFLRLFKAKYEIDQQLIGDIVEGDQHDQTMAAMEVLEASLPISSAFHDEEIPPGEQRPLRGKQLNTSGDLVPLPNVKAILDNDAPWIHETWEHQDSRHLDAHAHERLRHHLSRFEEMLYGDERRSEGDDLTEDEPFQHTETGRSEEHLDHMHDGEMEREASRNILLDFAEQGLSETLDPLFKDKETQHAEVIRTRSERRRWRSEIDRAVEERVAFQEELQNGGLTDPLMATAMNSSKSIVRVKRRPERTTGAPSAPIFRGEIVPTDAQSLSRREQEIAQRPLEDLLNETGYSTIDDESNAPRKATTTVNRAFESSHAEDYISRDPTLPQNRPNSEEKVPSRSQLEHFASLDEIEREISQRGGPGRLSYEEIEGVVQADTTRALRGLIIGWLEYASF